jgi:hypothetical protein
MIYEALEPAKRLYFFDKANQEDSGHSLKRAVIES